ncbi:MAG TPA: hypothetical protein VFB37_16155 [Steroidobacteraceae bacterium]|nr:hypothetical protein [Steroidobacteraceae bacterium]
MPYPSLHRPIPARWAAALAALALLLSGPWVLPSAAFAQSTAPTGPAASHATPPPAQAPASGAGSAAVAPAANAPPAAPAAAAPAAEAPPADAPQGESQADTRGLDQEVQGLKKDVVDLNRDLFVLEEELLFPANTQVAVFLSMDVGDFFALDSVTLKIDQKEVINYLYTPREVDALLKGGVHRLYLGNLKVGKHELVAFFSGKGPNERDYKRGATIKFEKGIGAKYLELKINDRQRRQQPEFEIKDWE